MRYSLFSVIRDILFLIALFFLGKVAFDRTYSFLNIHRKSIIHELDRSFIDQIYTAQRHLHFLQEYFPDDTYAHAFTEMQESLSYIEEKYKKNSPSLALLGPIGSAAIVTKEAQLQQKLLNIINNLGKILNTLSNSSEEFLPHQTIDNGLENNKRLLNILIP